MKNKEKKTVHCIDLIRFAFESNAKAHKFSEESQEAYYCGDHDLAGDFSAKKRNQYFIKSSIIEKIIKYIKKYSLPIKYGMNDWIVYFSYNWEQVSFHTFRREKKEMSYRYKTLKEKDSNIKPKIKAYNWIWKGTKNETFPIKLAFS